MNVNNYECPKCHNVFPESNKFLHDQRCTASNPVPLNQSRVDFIKEQEKNKKKEPVKHISQPNYQANKDINNNILQRKKQIKVEDEEKEFTCWLCGNVLKEKEKADHMLCHQMQEENDSFKKNNPRGYERIIDGVVNSMREAKFGTALDRIGREMPKEELKGILAKIEKTYEPIALLMTSENHPCIIKYTREVSKVFLNFYRLWWWFQFSYREPFTVDNEMFENELNNAKIYKIMTFIGLRKNKSKISKEINKELREEFPKIESSWTAQVNELTPQGCNKGNGVERYRQMMNINPDDVYVVGDSGNDISMFNAFHEHSYCMKRGHPSARKYAKHIIRRVYKLEKLILRGEYHE